MLFNTNEILQIKLIESHYAPRFTSEMIPQKFQKLAGLNSEIVIFGQNIITSPYWNNNIEGRCCVYHPVFTYVYSVILHYI